MLNIRETISELVATPVWEPRPPTFFEVLGIERQEMVASQLLAFFLDPAGEHGMEDAVLAALLEAADDRYADLLPVSKTDVKTEVTTTVGTRIDVLVETERFCLCVENKLYASLYNPLRLYREHMKTIATGGGSLGARTIPNREVICVVLALQDHSDAEEVKAASFRAVTYGQLLENLDLQPDAHGQGASDRYLLLLREFAETIHRLEGQDPVNEEFLKLVDERYDEIVKVAEGLEDLKAALRSRVDEVRQMVEGRLPSGSVVFRGFWTKPLFDSVVYRIPDGEPGMLDVSARISAEAGWTMRIRGFGISLDKLESWFRRHGFDVERSPGEERLLLSDGKFGFQEEQSEVGDRFVQFLERLTEELTVPDEIDRSD